jgi:hypothetical protein
MMAANHRRAKVIFIILQSKVKSGVDISSTNITRVRFIFRVNHANIHTENVWASDVPCGRKTEVQVCNETDKWSRNFGCDIG